ncbi:hypothetical protein ACFLU4_02085 [Chloroflexota bacterium]
MKILPSPTESEGDKLLSRPDREGAWVRLLYEKAIGGFYDVVLSPQGWNVEACKSLNWLIDQKTLGIDKVLPSMKADVILEHYRYKQRIVIDTKFTAILNPGWYRKETIKSGYLYQFYAYLQSQENDVAPPVRACCRTSTSSIDRRDDGRNGGYPRSSD